MGVWAKTKPAVAKTRRPAQTAQKTDLRSADGGRTLATTALGQRARRTLVLGVRCTRPATLDVEEDRTSDVDRAERTGEHTERHDPRERADYFAGEEQQRQRRREHGGMRQHRARQRFVDRAVQYVAQRFLALFLQVFAHAIEDDDRVIQRIADDGEDRRDDGQRDLEPQHGEERHGGENVVRRGDDRGDAEAPLEAERQIDQRDDERDEDGGDRLVAQLVAHARTDRLLRRRDRVAREASGEHRLDGRCNTIRVRRGEPLLERRLDHVVVRTAERCHFRAGESRLIDGAAYHVGRSRLREMQLNRGTTGELDTVVQRAAVPFLVHDEEREAEHDERDRRNDGGLPVLDEVVLGVVKNAQHG